MRDTLYMIIGVFFFVFGMWIFASIPIPGVAHVVGTAFVVIGMALFVVGFFITQKFGSANRT